MEWAPASTTARLLLPLPLQARTRSLRPHQSGREAARPGAAGALSCRLLGHFDRPGTSCGRTTRGLRACWYATRHNTDLFGIVLLFFLSHPPHDFEWFAGTLVGASCTARGRSFRTDSGSLSEKPITVKALCCLSFEYPFRGNVWLTAVLLV